MKDNYYIGGGDYLGDNSPNEKFNKVYVPRLLELGIKPEDMDEVASMFEDVYEIGWSNGELYIATSDGEFEFGQDIYIKDCKYVHELQHELNSLKLTKEISYESLVS